MEEGSRRGRPSPLHGVLTEMLHIEGNLGQSETLYSFEKDFWIRTREEVTQSPMIAHTGKFPYQYDFRLDTSEILNQLMGVTKNNAEVFPVRGEVERTEPTNFVMNILDNVYLDESEMSWEERWLNVTNLVNSGSEANYSVMEVQRIAVTGLATLSRVAGIYDDWSLGKEELRKMQKKSLHRMEGARQRGSLEPSLVVHSLSNSLIDNHIDNTVLKYKAHSLAGFVRGKVGMAISDARLEFTEEDIRNLEGYLSVVGYTGDDQDIESPFELTYRSLSDGRPRQLNDEVIHYRRDFVSQFYAFLKAHSENWSIRNELIASDVLVRANSMALSYSRDLSPHNLEAQERHNVVEEFYLDVFRNKFGSGCTSMEELLGNAEACKRVIDPLVDIMNFGQVPSDKDLLRSAISADLTTISNGSTIKEMADQIGVSKSQAEHYHKRLLSRLILINQTVAQQHGFKFSRHKDDRAMVSIDGPAGLHYEVRLTESTVESLIANETRNLQKDIHDLVFKSLGREFDDDITKLSSDVIPNYIFENIFPQKSEDLNQIDRSTAESYRAFALKFWERINKGGDYRINGTREEGIVFNKLRNRLLIIFALRNPDLVRNYGFTVEFGDKDRSMIQIERNSVTPVTLIHPAYSFTAYLPGFIVRRELLGKKRRDIRPFDPSMAAELEDRVRQNKGSNPGNGDPSSHGDIKAGNGAGVVTVDKGLAQEPKPADEDKEVKVYRPGDTFKIGEQVYTMVEMNQMRPDLRRKFLRGTKDVGSIKPSLYTKKARLKQAQQEIKNRENLDDDDSDFEDEDIEIEDADMDQEPKTFTIRHDDATAQNEENRRELANDNLREPKRSEAKYKKRLR